MQQHIEKWTEYRDTRVADYAFRCTRYRAVVEKLFEMGLRNNHTVMDVGAGTCQLGRYLRESGFRGVYVPVDAVIDGVDLETWEPHRADFITCLEVLEHLHNPSRLLNMMTVAARLGIVVTTPNPEVVDVLQCDPTHVSVVTYGDLHIKGFDVERCSFFNLPDDSLLGWLRL